MLLKDIFRYGEAEAVHLDLIEEMRKSRSLDHVKGENLSSLSQLYLAMGRYGEAEKYQRQALFLIKKSEVCRNYGYLAQIHSRSGNFRKAASALYQYRRLLEESDGKVRGAHTPFYDWIRAEYLYRHGTRMKGGKRAVFRELHEMAENYPEQALWVPALVRKFSGLAHLAEGEESRGLEELKKVIGFFNARFEPVQRLLGASVKVERALYCIRAGRPEAALVDIAGVIEDLTLQKDIKRFFRSETRDLSRFLRAKRHRETQRKQAKAALGEIRKRIPY